MGTLHEEHEGDYKHSISFIMMWYVAPEWQDMLDHHGLGDFESVWALDQSKLEATGPTAPGGRSDTLVSLTLPMGGGLEFMLQRQEDRVLRSWRHPVRGQSLLLLEYYAIQRAEALGLSAVEVVCCGQRMENGTMKAVLLTRALDGYHALDDPWWRRVFSVNRNGLVRKQVLIHRLAEVLRELHRQRRAHNALSADHVFAMLPDQGGAEICLLHQRGMVTVRRRSTAMMKDLDMLNRSTPMVSRSDKLRFFKAYVQATRLSRKHKKYCRILMDQANASER